MIVVATSLSNWLSLRSGMLSSCVATCSHDCSLFRQSFCVRSDVSELHSSSRAASSMPAARFEGAAPSSAGVLEFVEPRNA